MRLILGLGHRRQRGKDTAAKMLQEIFVDHKLKRPRIDAFARSLKDGIGCGVFGLSEAQLYGDQKAVVDPFWQLTPRDILQRSGTEGMRHVFGEDIWVKTLQHRLAKDVFTNVIVTDVRFKNEAAAIKQVGGLLIRIDRNVEETDADLHASEVDLLNYGGWDHIVPNFGTKAELYTRLDTFVTLIKKEL